MFNFFLGEKHKILGINLDLSLIFFRSIFFLLKYGVEAYLSRKAKAFFFYIIKAGKTTMFSDG